MYFNLFYKNLNNRVLPNSEFPNYQMSKVQLNILALRHFSITTFFVCWLVTLSAQEPWHHHITTYDGLPSNTVYWMMQDSRDYMWMGTEGGLTRYDGKDFVTFNDHSDLKSYDFNSVYEDTKGDIWSHNFANQIIRLRGDSMTVFENDLFTQKGEYIEMILCEHDDIYVRITDKIVRYFPEQNDYEILYDHTLYGKMYYLTYAEGILSIMTNDSSIFFRYDETHNTSTNIRLKVTQDNMRLKAFQITKEQTLITDVLNLPKDIYTIKNDSLVVFDNLDKYDLPKSFKINNIKRLSNGDIWYCTNKGIYRQRDGLHLLPGINTSNIITDKEDNLWISSLGEGVFVFPDLSVHFYTPDNSNLYISDPASITFDEDDNLFIGTVRGKILYWDTKLKKVALEYEANIASDMSEVYYDVVTQYLWTNGLFKFKKGKPRYEQAMLGNSIKQAFALPNHEIIIRSGRDRLYQLYQHDLNQLPQNGFSDAWQTVSIVFRKAYRLEGGIFKSPINTVHYDVKDDKIWLALGNRTMINTRDTIQEFFVKENESIVSNCFEQSPDGDMWIGIKGGGFIVVNKNKVQLDFRNEIYKNYGDIRLIKCTEKHTWLLTERVLLVVDYQGKILSQYNPAMGIEANNITDMAVSGEKAWLCSKNGLISIDFRQQQFGKPPAPILRAVEIQGIAQPEGSYRFPYHKNTLNTKFTSTNPYTKTDFEYLYRLKGEHDNWCIASTESAYYPRLSPNTYTFELKTRSKNGNESPVVDFDIQIKKPFWQNIWFILISVLGIAAILFWAYSRNEQRKAERNHYDQQLRTSQLTALKTQMNPHFMFNALNSIQEFITLNEKRLANEYLSKFARLMRVYLNHSSKDWVPLEEEVQALKLYLDLEKLRFENAQIRLNVDPKLEIEHILIPPLFVQPYVENAFKHGLLHKPNDRKLNVSFDKTANNTLQIIIEDNGVGRKKAMDIKSKRTNKNLSFSMTANKQRLQLLNYNKQQQIEVEIIDLEKDSRAAGTKVIIRIPSYELTG